ncbi:unnamed protein product [Phyllotreta striolata]|uniref:Lipid droplet-associated hydrolase n=1 Tax=Phyllotreta striolata TaxID=444603 RepID=A0A9N9TK58_PHYSR|nr:unnamed protein product [Phyllotreta striolata]
MGKIKETYLEINRVPTRIATVGKQVGEQFEDSEDLVILIPGNPGTVSFYDKFQRRIHEKLGCSVWCLGHAGHNFRTRKTEAIPSMEDHKDLYGLDGQVKHKVSTRTSHNELSNSHFQVEFFEKHVPHNARIHLIGHSIGSYMVLEMLEQPAIKKQVDKSYLLFPTLEFMAKTPNGKFLINFIKPIIWLVILLSALFVSLPVALQNASVLLYIYIVRIRRDNLDSIKRLIKPGVLRRVFFLAYEEMDLVLQRNDRSIRNNIDKIKLLYGRSDGWTPLSYYERIKKDHPGIDADLTTFNHAFVLNASLEVADLVCDWIGSK